jgi:hypothetical protein
MKTLIERSVVVLSVLSLFAVALFSQNRALASLDEVLQAHGNWKVVPLSIQITGTSTRDGGTSPVQITATNQEEVLYQYGEEKKYVATPTSHFEADVSKMTQEPTPSGFAQLDVTSVFLLMQLRQRRITMGQPEAVNLPSGPGTHVRIRGERSEWHYRRFKVPDQLDLYIDGNGLIEGISRTFYENEPRWERTVAVRFAEYRETRGVRLPYRIERYDENALIETIQVHSYAFDVPAGPGLFARGRVR